MSAVLRITLTYFSVVPLQSWISGIGAALMLLSVVIGAGSGAVACAFAGAALTALIPALVGGSMLRHASSRSILHLRPQGRLLMLLAATLVITLLAAMATLPLLVFGDVHGLHDLQAGLFHEISPLGMFALGWSTAALVWLCVFFASGSRALGPLMGFMPLILVWLGRHFAPVLPDPLALLAASLAAWGAFGLWYMRVPAIQHLFTQGAGIAMNMEGTPLGILQSRINASRSSISPASATNQYLLGSSSLLGYVLLAIAQVSLAILAVLLWPVVQFNSPGELGAVRSVAQIVALPLLSMACASRGFWLTRRARLLWLRLGQDRAALFARAERGGLLAVLLSLGVVAIAFLSYSLASWPGHAQAILVFGGVQLTLATCLFYCGLSLTRGWDAGDVLLCLGFCILFLVEIITLRPWNDTPAGVPILPAIVVMLVPLMRWHARRRWLVLDWRVAKLLPRESHRT